MSRMAKTKLRAHPTGVRLQAVKMEDGAAVAVDAGGEDGGRSSYRGRLRRVQHATAVLGETGCVLRSLSQHLRAAGKFLSQRPRTTTDDSDSL